MFGQSSGFGASSTSFATSSSPFSNPGHPDIFSAMMAYYKVVDESRANADSVNKALSKYAGDEGTMISKLEQKYRRPFPSYQKGCQSHFSSSSGEVSMGMDMSTLPSSGANAPQLSFGQSSTFVLSPPTSNVGTFGSPMTSSLSAFGADSSKEDAGASTFGNGFGKVMYIYSIFTL